MNQTSNHFRYKLIIGLLLCIGISGIYQETGAEEGKPILVLPFKVTPSHEKAHQWLGRAISFYITSGLQRNLLPTYSDSFTAALLERNHIMFPYNITKATLIRLARENQISKIIRGEIELCGDERDENSVTDKSMLQLQLYIIDLSDFSQKYLPVINGHINDFSKIKNKILTAIVKTLNPGEHETNLIQYPQFNLDHRNYEIFIKSLLIKETSKRIELLENARKANQEENSALLDFELAKLYFSIGNPETSKTFLEKMPAEKETPGSQFMEEKRFLEGLITYAGGDINTAIKIFTSLKQDHGSRFEIHHNLGVIYFKREDVETAAMHFELALEEKKDPETWLNLIHVLLDHNPQQAVHQLN